MKKVTFKSASASFGKEWILPTSGKAIIAFSLTSLLLEQLDTSTNPTALLDGLSAKMAGVVSTPSIVMLSIVGVFLLASLAIKLRAASKAPGPLLHRFSRYGTWFATAIAFIAGTLIFPIAIWAAAAIKFGGGANFSNPHFIQLATTVFAYIIVSSAIHWIILESKNDAKSAMLWYMTQKPGGDLGAARTAIDNHFKVIPWIESADLVCTADDGFVTVVLPIVYAVDKWSKEDCEAFMKAYDRRYEIMKNSGFAVKGMATSPDLHSLINARRSAKAGAPKSSKVAN